MEGSLSVRPQEKILVQKEKLLITEYVSCCRDRIVILFKPKETTILSADSYFIDFSVPLS